MTPGARLAAAIGVLDLYLGGAPVEKTLTNWARGSRYAGSKDRAAVRDIVFDCVRCRASFAAYGGAKTGRGLALGWVLAQDGQPADWFHGDGYGPGALSAAEAAVLAGTPVLTDAQRLDCPEWLLPSFRKSLGDDCDAVLDALKTRAPVHLRVNLRKTPRADVIDLLRDDDIDAVAHDLCDTALTVTRNPRRIKQSAAWLQGLVELQDVASQAVVTALPDAPRMLDYCAGGGGKALAYADRNAQVFAHDAQVGRMRDLPARAARAGVAIAQLGTDDLAQHAPFDVVLCDVPCSGTGAWRRAPEGKWALTSERLEALRATQAEILTNAAALVAEDGVLAYATCSLLGAENEDQIAAFCADMRDWRCVFSRRFTPLDGGDGFFTAHIRKDGRKDG